MNLDNIKAVPFRQFGDLECVSDSLLRTMRDELVRETLILTDELRPMAGVRNGLMRVETEMKLREIL